MLSNNDDKMIARARIEALKSPCKIQHGCVAAINGKYVSGGYNHYRHHSNSGIIDNPCSCHAEMGVMRRICYNNREKKHKLNRIMKKTKLYISRFSVGGKSTNSAPCVKCLSIIKEYNIRKII